MAGREGPVGRAVDQDLKAAVGVKGAGTLDQVLQDAVGKNDMMTSASTS